MKNKISIIIPAYNVEKYIEDCLNSVKNQTVKPDEIILINDGSTDSTIDKVNKYKNLNNLRIINNINSSPGASRELGKNLASSEFIYFLDADDFITNNFVEKIKNILTNNPKLDLIVFEAKSFTNEKNLAINDTFNKKGEFNSYERPVKGFYEKTDEFIYESLKSSTFWSQPSIYVSRKSIWAKNRIYFPSYGNEDEAVLLELFIFSKNILSLQEKLVHKRYRENSDSATCTLGIKNIDGYLQCSLRLISLLKSKRLKTKSQYRNTRLRLSIIFKLYLEICYKCKKFPSLSLLLATIFNVKRLIWTIKVLIRYLQNIFLMLLKRIFA